MYYKNMGVSSIFVIHLSIMSKRLRVIVAWVAGCIAIIGGIAFVACEQQTAAEKYKIQRKEYCAGMRAFTAEQEKACEEEDRSPSDYLPWGYKLVAWPEGIATWAFLATLVAIIWQAIETRRAATATADAANATYGSVRYAEAQFDLMKEKERARLDVQSGTMSLEQNPQNEYWHLKGTLKTRNIGQSRAFIIGSQAALRVKAAGADYPTLQVYENVPFADSFVDPDPANAFAEHEFVFSSGQEDKIRFLAEDLHAQRRSINLYGFIEYETLGMRFRKEIGFVWNVIDPSWHLGGLTGNQQPITDDLKITFGYWSIDPGKEKPEYPISRDSDESEIPN